MNKPLDYTKEIEKISKQIVKEPDNVILYKKRAGIYWLNKNFDKAIDDVSVVIKFNPAEKTNYFLRGINYEEIEQYDKAIRDYEKVREIDPKDEDIIIRIGEIYFKLKKYEKSYEYFRKIINNPYTEIDDDLAENIAKIGEYYFSIKEYDRAMEIFSQLPDLNIQIASDYDSWGSMANIYKEKQTKLNKDIERKILKIDIANKNKIARAKLDERDRIIRSQAHDIKNIISTIINPLMILKRTTNNPQIDRALKQAEVLSKMVNAVSLSYSGSEKDFYYDAKHNSAGMSLKDMITSSVEASIGNIMQIVKYYKPFWEQYFPQYDLYEKALAEYTRLHEETDNKSFGLLVEFLSKYMFDISIEFGDSDALIIGDKKGSDVKLLTLFNEIIFNAIKYTAFVKKEDRVVSIKFNSSHEFKNLEVENSLSGDTEVKSVGTGNLIIDNIINIMKGKVSRSKLNNRFITKIKFPNFWEEKNNGKDIVC